MTKMIRCFLFCGAQVLATLAYAEESPRSLNLLFSDEFDHADSAPYTIEGPPDGFEIRDGYLAISKGVSASRGINSDQSLVVEFDLRAPEEIPENERVVFSIGFQSRDIVYRCVISHYSYQPTDEYGVSLEALTSDGSTAWHRQADAALSGCDGHWQLLCKDGRFAVTKDEKRLIQFFSLPNPSFEFSELQMRSEGVMAYLDSLACFGQQLPVDQRDRLRLYEQRARPLAVARSASADHRHLEAVRQWHECVDGWPKSNRHTASVAFVQMQCALAEITSGSMTDGLARMEQAWPSLLAAVAEDHPWRFAGESVLREAHQELKRRVLDRPSHEAWKTSFTRMWDAWAELSWNGKASLEFDNQQIQNRWQLVSELDEETWSMFKNAQTNASIAHSKFAQGDVAQAFRLTQDTIPPLKRLLDRQGSKLSFLREELGDLFTLACCCQFSLPDLKMQELESHARSAQELWSAILPKDHPKQFVAAHNVACVEFLRGNWVESERVLRNTWQRAKKSLGESAPETLESQSALGMLLLQLGEPVESENLRVDTVWRYSELTTAGRLPVTAPTIEVFAIRQELIEHPSLIMFFGAAAPGPNSFDPMLFHADSLSLARVAARVDQLTPPIANTPWNEPYRRAQRAIGKLASLESPLRTMAMWLGYQGLSDDQIDALPKVHPWRVWLQRYRSANAFHVSESPPSVPVVDLSEFQIRDFQRLHSALKESIAVFGGEHPETAWCHEALAIANYSLGRLDEANRHASTAAAIFDQRLDERHFRTLAVRNTKGIIEYYRQNLTPAFEILQQNVRDRQASLGDHHIETLRSLSDLAVVARSRGRYDIARRLIEHAIDQWPQGDWTDRNAMGFKSREYRQIALVNRCVLQAESGDYTSAEAGLKDLLQDETFSDKHHEILLSLSSIAIMKDDFGAAESYLLKAQSLLRNRQFPQEDPQVDHLLGVVYREQGELVRSRESLEKALEQRRASQTGAPYELGDTLTSLGILEQKEGNFGKSLQVLTEAAATQLQRLGPTGLRQADSIRRVALAAQLVGQNEMAIQTGEIALKMKRQLVDVLAPSLSESETLLFANTLTELEPLISALSVDRTKNATRALQSIWQRKAIVTNLLERRRIRLRDITDSDVQQKVDQLRLVRHELATILGPQFRSEFPVERNSRDASGNFFDPNQRSQRLQRLTTQKESLERELAGLSGHDEPPLDATIDAVAKGMKPNTALIEFLKVNLWKRVDAGTAAANVQPVPTYQVFILIKDADQQIQVHWRELGSAETIEPLVSELRRLIELQMQRVRGLTLSDDDVNELDDPGGYERVGKSLSTGWTDLIAGSEHLFIVPDGILHALPWAALPGQQGNYLIEETSISLLSRGPELLREIQDNLTVDHFLLVGDVAYGQYPALSVGPNWQSLAGTRRELDSIGQLIRNQFSVTLLDELAATESKTIDQMRDANFVHLATHGFYAPVRLDEPSSASPAWRDPILASPAGRNPLSRCGVVLAGANRLPEMDTNGIPSGSDGLLTGEELCDVDLQNVELVVLSACETGLGQVTENEGAFGLHKALSRAGVESTIGSLWKVSDDATTELMNEFYRALLTENVGVADALRQAQLRLLRGSQIDKNESSRFAAPFFWAAFVTSGNPDLRAGKLQVKYTSPRP